MDMGENQPSPEFEQIDAELGGLNGQGEQQTPSGEQQAVEPVAEPQSSAQQQSSDWDAQKWPLVYQGQTIYPKDRSQLINLAQQGYSYSDAMAKLKKYRTNLDQQYKPYVDLRQALENDPNLAQHISAALQGYYGKQQQKDTQQQVAQLPPEVIQKLSDLESWKTQTIEKQADEQLNGEIDKLKQKYADQSWDANDGNGTLTYRVLKHAYDGNYPSLEAAFRDMMWDNYKVVAQTEALKKNQQQRQAAAKTGIVPSGQQAPPPAKGVKYQQGDSWDSLMDKAVTELQNK